MRRIFLRKISSIIAKSGGICVRQDMKCSTGGREKGRHTLREGEEEGLLLLTCSGTLSEAPSEVVLSAGPLEDAPSTLLGSDINTNM